MNTKREDRSCQVCYSSEDVKDEHHLLLDCPAYNYGDVRKKTMIVFTGRHVLFQTTLHILSQIHVVIFPERL